MRCIENVLVSVKQLLFWIIPRTVVNRHRAGFRLYRTWISRARQIRGQKRACNEALIFRMVAANARLSRPPSRDARETRRRQSYQPPLPRLGTSLLQRHPEIIGGYH